MKAVDGRRFDERMAELDRAPSEVIAVAEAEPARWARGRSGKWTAGQRAAHLVISAVGRILTAAQRDRLWIRNPFLPRWHYRLVEMVHVHAVLARHQLALMRRT